MVELDREVFKRLSEDTVKELLKVMETTTVTKKLRRISRLSEDELAYAVRINRPDYIVMNFMNYQFPELWDWQEGEDIYSSTMKDMKIWCSELIKEVKCPIKYISWHRNHMLEVYF